MKRLFAIPRFSFVRLFVCLFVFVENLVSNQGDVSIPRHIDIDCSLYHPVSNIRYEYSNVWVALLQHRFLNL